MDEKIISAIQEYKNKQKKYNSKLKESLKKEVLQTQQPKPNNSIQKKQELEELRRELDLLNDLDNFDHLPPDPITDKDTPSYEEYDEDKSNNEYDEYLIIKDNNTVTWVKFHLITILCKRCSCNRYSVNIKCATNHNLQS